MLDEKALLKEVHEDLICHSAALRKVFQVEGGELVAEGEHINYLVNGNHMFITYIPYDYEREDIDLRIRKRLAKEFLELHTLESLKAEYIAELDKQEEEEKRRQEDYRTLQNDFVSLEEVLKRFTSAECREYASYSVIKAEYRYQDISHRLENKNTQLEIKFSNGLYRAEYSYCIDGYTTSRDHVEGTLEEVKTFIVNTVYPIIDTLQSAADSRLKAHEEKQAKENAIIDILNDIRIGDQWYILKSKRAYTAIKYNKKYSMKGEGKYMKPNYSKILDDIKNGKIEAYAICEDYPDRKTYLELEYISFNQIA